MDEAESIAGTEPTSGRHEATTELREFLHIRDDRHRVFPRAALVGLAAGLVAVAFRSLLALCDYLRTHLALWSHSIPWIGWIAPVSYSAGTGS